MKRPNIKTHPLYDKRRFSWRQVRDCVEGSHKIKEANEIYLPMPSAMNMQEAQVASATSRYTNDSTDYQRQYLPWWHPNPAYRAYLQRARFPDITANTLRGSLGVSTKNPPSYELPSQIEYLIEDATPEGDGLEELFSSIVSEVIQVGKACLVLDVNESGDFYISVYTAESNIDWEMRTVDGAQEISRITFIDGYDDDENPITRTYEYDDFGNVIVIIESGKESEIIEPKYKGKSFTKIPVICIGSVNNTPDPDIVPLLGISDIAIAIYQENADLRQGHYMTCNPTLFVFGISPQETPRVIGSGVIVGIQNPQGKAEYPSTDTSAFEHIKGCIQDLFQEAVSYGANFVAGGERDSAEALSLKSSAKGANLLHISRAVAKGIRDSIDMICDFTGADKNAVLFEANTEYTESILTSQDITALVTSWIQGVIDHDTVLDNFRDAGYIAADKSNEEVRQAIAESPPPMFANPLNLDSGEDDGDGEQK